MDWRANRRLIGWAASALSVLLGVAALAGMARAFDAHPPAIIAAAALDEDAARATLALAAAALSSTMGLVMAWVLVAVNMTARRYSLRVIDLYLSPWTTAALIALFAGSILTALVAQASVRPGAPRPVSVVLVMGLCGCCLLLVVPYLYHLTSVLRPAHLVARLNGRAAAAVRRSRTHGSAFGERETVIEVIEQASDVAMAGLQAADLELAEESLWMLRDLLLSYQQQKGGLSSPWFVANQDDFVGRSPDDLRDMEKRRTWLETYVGLKLKVAFGASLGRLPEACGLIAEILRDVGDGARRIGDLAGLTLTVHVFNSLLRMAINRHDISALYNVLSHYRRLAETLLHEQSDVALAMARHLSYYGSEGIVAGLDRAFVTTAYDLRLLTLAGLREGVRPAELVAVLAGALREGVARRPGLAVEAAKPAVIVLASAPDEASEALAPLRGFLASLPASAIDEAVAQVEAVETPEFWEITERGVNFDYVDASVRCRLRAQVPREAARAVGIP